MLILAIVPTLALNIGLLQQPSAPRSGFPPYQVEWENDAVRVGRMILPPGQRATAESSSGAVIVFLTADLSGRMPAAEAAWQEPGTIELENHGHVRFEAIIIQFKQPAVQDARTPTVPPAYLAPGAAAGWPMYATGRTTYGDEPVNSQTLIDRPGLTVTKERHPVTTSVDPVRVDPNDTVVVYLRGGYVWSAEPWQPGAVRVHRGDVRVLPANSLYSLGNAGSDPSEFVVVARR
jgi:hypothetical protein